MIFPKDAKNANRLIGLWKDLERQNVRMMNPAPKSEKTEATRVVVSRIASCRLVQVILYNYPVGRSENRAFDWDCVLFLFGRNSSGMVEGREEADATSM